MFNVDEWLNKPYKEGIPLHKRISFLVFANKGFEVTSWGYIGHNGIHQEGLSQEEAIELITYGAFMLGLSEAGVPIFEKFYVNGRRENEIFICRCFMVFIVLMVFFLCNQGH